MWSKSTKRARTARRSPFTAKLIATARSALALGRAAYRAGNRRAAARALAVARRAFRLVRLATYVQVQARAIGRTSRVMHAQARVARARAAARRRAVWMKAPTWSWSPQPTPRRRRGPVDLTRRRTWQAFAA